MSPLDDPSQDEVVAILNGMPKVSALPLVPLAEYRMLARHLPPPTSDQIQAFASHVADAKSWYKHLPFLPPGTPFHFFVDPRAGLDRMRTRDGAILFGERTNDTFRFHYTWMTTADYHTHFGSPRILLRSAGRAALLANVRLLDSEDGTEIKVGRSTTTRVARRLTVPGVRRVPAAAGDPRFAGMTDLTAVIHAQAAAVPRVLSWRRSEASDGAPRSWPRGIAVGPASSGGSAPAAGRSTAQHRAGSHRTESAAPAFDEVDEELDRLLAPERRRLHELMVLRDAARRRGPLRGRAPEPA